MTKTVFVALTISCTTVAAQGAIVVAPPPSAPGAEGFSLTALIDGTDHILMSVDNRPQASLDPFGAQAAAFVPAAVVATRADPVASAANYSSADNAAQEPLPEPTTWLMMILGFFGLSFAVRRRSSVPGDRVRFS